MVLYIKKMVNLLDSWESLNAHVLGEISRGDYFVKKIFASVDRKPFQPDSLDQLQREGWKIHLEQLGFGNGMTINQRREIKLEESLSHGDRDLVIFHELMHAWYGQCLDDSVMALSSTLIAVNSTVAEWLGRKYRADPLLLRKAVLSFGLVPNIYDKASYLAFYFKPDGQLELPFVQEIEEKMRVLMDYTTLKET